MKETLKHREAFEYYYSLGEERSYQKVADEFNTTKTTVYRWATRFGWLERVEQRDIEISKKVESKNVSKIADEKARYRTIIKAGIQEFTTKLRNGEIEIDSVRDFEKLVKLDLLLMGEATERNEEQGEVHHAHEITHQFEHDKESRELFKELWRRRMETNRTDSSEK